jgi:hypothetical protein
MNRRTISTLALVLCVVPLIGQAPASRSFSASSGSIEGVPIADKDFSFSRSAAVARFVSEQHRLPDATADDGELLSHATEQVCGHLQAAVINAVRSAEQRRLAIAASQVEMEEYAKTRPFDAARELAVKQEHARLILPALAEVYDRHQSPETVYSKSLADLGVNHDLWLMEVEQGSTSKGHQQLEASMHFTVETLTSSYAAAVAGGLYRVPVERKKLDDAVDSLIAANDPVFRAYTAERKAQPAGYAIPASHATYLQQKRGAWWKNATSRLNVWLSDPSLASTCQLTQMGVVLPSK